MGQKITRTRVPKRASKRCEGESFSLFGKTVQRQVEPNSLFRLFHTLLGGARQKRKVCTRVLTWEIYWHINIKELLAATNTVKSLAKKWQTIKLNVDNVVAFYYFVKGGGRKSQFNHILRPFLLWCLQNVSHLQMQLVRSENMLADPYSRWGWTSEITR